MLLHWSVAEQTISMSDGGTVAFEVDKEDFAVVHMIIGYPDGNKVDFKFARNGNFQGAAPVEPTPTGEVEAQPAEASAGEAEEPRSHRRRDRHAGD